MQDPEADPVPPANEVPLPIPASAPLMREQHQRALNHLTRPAVLSTTPNALALLLALRRRWLLALTLGLLVGAGAGAGAYFVRPVTFSARTLMEVKSDQPTVLFRIAESRSDFNNYQRVQVALAKSRLVLNSALRDPKAEKLAIVLKQDDPVAWLEKEVHADFSTAPEIMRIAMTGEDTTALPILVDAVRRAYMREIVQKETRARLTRLEQLRKNYAEYDSSLKEKRATLKGMAQRLGSPNEKVVGAKQEFNDKFLHQLQSELLKLRSEVRNAELEQLVDKAKKDGTDKVRVPDAVIEQLLKNDAVVLRLHKVISDQELLIAQFNERSPRPDREPGYQQAKKLIDAANTSIKKRREDLRPTIMQQVREKTRDDLELRSLQLGDRVAFLKIRETKLEEEVGRFAEHVKTINNDSVDLYYIKDDIEQLDSLSKEISKQMQKLTLEMQAPARVSVLEEAIVLPAQTEANRVRFAGGVGFGGFAAIILAIAFLEFRTRRVNNIEQISQGLKMKLVGSLPHVPRRALFGKSSKAQNNQWQNRLMESVDAIRTTLLNGARIDGLRRVMVTSAVGGEGKTLLSCHLAVSLARAGMRTLLIDGDLRRPSVHKLFHLALGQGLSDLLRGTVEPSAVVNAGPIETLSVVTAGLSDAQAIQSLSGERIVTVLQQLSQDYDFVIVDSAPVLPVADAQLIGQHVDGVVFSVMRDVSRLPVVYEAYERLALLRVRILGAVVNGADASHYRSSYYGTQTLTPAATSAAAPEKAAV